MKAKQRMLSLTIILALLLGLFSVTAETPRTVSAQDIKATPTAAPTVVTTKGEEGKTDPNLTVEKSDQGRKARIAELNRVLGTPLAELEKMSSKEIRQMYMDHAEELGVVVLKTKINKDGQEEVVKIAGSTVKKVKKDKAPTDPYPAPGQGSVDRINTLTTLSYDWNIFLPSVMNENLEADLNLHLEKAGLYLDSQFQSGGSLGFMKEYPGCPLSIRDTTHWNDRYGVRFAGHYYVSVNQPVAKITEHVVGFNYDWSTYTFEGGNIGRGWVDWDYGEPEVWCDVYYQDGGVTKYNITKVSWGGDPTPVFTLYLGDNVIFGDVINTPNWSEVALTTGPNGRMVSNRFTIRHATHLGIRYMGDSGQSTKANQLYNTSAGYGFVGLPDLYEPIYESGMEAPVDYMYNQDIYHDCTLLNQGMDSWIPHGYSPHRIAYESKVCVLGVNEYITLSRLDYLAPALQALHVMNKYGPDYAYPHPARPWENTTPRNIARWLETLYNGYGIPVYLKDTTYASGIRSNAFLALESKLGYGYGDTTSKVYADNMVKVLLQVQWGVAPFPTWEGETAEGNLYRPNQIGGELLMWRTGGSYIYGLPDRSILSDIIDMTSMPNETLAPITSNTETTLSYWGALRMYRKYRFGY